VKKLLSPLRSGDEPALCDNKDCLYHAAARSKAHWGDTVRVTVSEDGHEFDGLEHFDYVKIDVFWVESNSGGLFWWTLCEACDQDEELIDRLKRKATP
jgi:hypothetical protein